MTYKTHTALALAGTLSLGFLPKEINPFFVIDNPLFFPLILFVVFVSSLAPDFDEPGSYLSSRFPWIIISKIISSFASHRGITHRFLAIFVFGGIIGGLLILTKMEKELWVLIFFGSFAYFLHLLGDGMTRGGLQRFFYPFSKKTIWFLPKPLRFYTGSFIESIILFFILIIIFIESYFLFIINHDFVNNLLKLS